MDNVLEIIGIVSSVIGTIFPIVKFVIEKKHSKNNENKPQQNTSIIIGNNNIVQQQNNNSIQKQNKEKETVIIKKYYNYPNKNPTASNTEISAGAMIILGIAISLFLCYVFIKFNTIIISAYLIAFGILMFVICFSPLTRKHKVIYYLTNIALLCLTLVITYKKLWNSDVITLYNQLFKEPNLGTIISYIFENKSMSVIKVILIMIAQLAVSITSVIQCVYLSFSIILQKIKGFSEDISNRVFDFMWKINIIPITVFISLILINFIFFIQNKAI